MNPEVIATIALSFVGMVVSWAVWVSFSVFKHAQEIALLKQQNNILSDVKNVLDQIREKLD